MINFLVDVEQETLQKILKKRAIPKEPIGVSVTSSAFDNNSMRFNCLEFGEDKEYLEIVRQ